MANLSEATVRIDLSKKTASVSFADPTGGFIAPRVTVSNVPWDTPAEQTETEINRVAIENAKAILRQIA